MRRCAFLTLASLRPEAAEDRHVEAPLAELGWRLDFVAWDRPGVDWSAFDAVVIRSTWDYIHAPRRFLDVLASIDRASRLANPLELVRWNHHKSYLLELAEAGAPVLPALCLERFAAGSAAELSERLGADELVLKPLVGADGEGVLRLPAEATPAEHAAVAGRYADAPCLVQPFVRSVMEEGERSLIFLDGELSHGCRKLPPAGEFRVQEHFGGRNVAWQPDAAAVATARRVLDRLPCRPLYARVDLVRWGEQQGEATDRVMEIELIEPSLYLATDPASPRRFAAAVDRWFGDAEAGG